jgi:hypothetical protein
MAYAEAANRSGSAVIFNASSAGETLRLDAHSLGWVVAESAGTTLVCMLAGRVEGVRDS